MYSESFWLLLRDFKAHLLTSYSDVEVEHIIFKELQSDSYANFRKQFIDSQREFPEIRI